MKAKTLQVVWHSKEPVYSVDFHPDGFIATCGADKDIKFWEPACDADGNPGVRYLCSLSGHARTVNCVRFSPQGDVLASAGDGGEIFLWRHAASGARGSADAADGAEGALWKPVATLRGLREDVQDLAWAPDGSALLAGGVENEAVVFEVESRKAVARFADHKHYVQGVCWDPLGQFVVTQSVDRTCRVYTHKQAAAGKRAAVGASCAAQAKDLIPHCTLSRRTLPALLHAHVNLEAGGGSDAAEAAKAAKPVPVPLFHDEGITTFFRRLAWSPDGSFLVVPAGMYRAHADDAPSDACYLYARGDWSMPAVQLPSTSKGTPVVVRCCPQLFRCPSTDRGEDVGPFALPYRVVYAVGTLDSVMLYTTQSLAPVVLLGSLHYAPITDMAWSPDGRTLMVASHDGYCSMVTFKPGELGEPLAPEELPPAHAARLQHLRSQVPNDSGACAASRSNTAAGAAAPLCPSPLGPLALSNTAAAVQAAGGRTAVLQPRQPQRITPQRVPGAGGAALAQPAAQPRPRDAAAQPPGVKRIPAEPVSAPRAAAAPSTAAAPKRAAPARITPMRVEQACEGDGGRAATADAPGVARSARAAAVSAAQAIASGGAAVKVPGTSLALQALRAGLAAASKRAAPVADAAASTAQGGSTDSSGSKKPRLDM